ncbi:GNAT family N-acetyltransferase [Candidatus Soleaferrea massiliensis]|uniref:GNAT family N-acetyltransferase n=1 Tax=Candidatus Soleaferrea massiliensis TaxID=1470354 RepID=UPI00058C9C0B|nr:GNAT family N-acetyltransferase [Candidatus Soleaferrea massiliensis]
MNQNRILETPRTYLRNICQDDFDEIAAILGNIEVMYAWEHAFTDEEIYDWIKENRLRYSRDGYSYWAVVLKDTGRIIGVSGIFKEDADGQEYIGIGYIFHKAFWHQGFAFECAAACKNYAFHMLHIPFLTAQIRPDNPSSIRIAERLGMSAVKRFVRTCRGKPVSHILYRCQNNSLHD